MDIFSALHHFLVYLRLHKGRSRKTQEQYTFHILRFISYIASINSADLPKIQETLPPIKPSTHQNWKSPLLDIAKKYADISISSIKKEDINEWRLSLADQGLSIKTVNAHMITMRSWLKFLKKEQIDCLDPTVIDLMKSGDREVTFLTSEEVDRFFDIIPKDTIIGKRDRAICECIYSTGLRISELTNLDISDIDIKIMEFAVRGKGNKLRTVYLTERAGDAIQTYLDDRDDHFSPLFIRHNFSIKNIQSSELDNNAVRLSRFFITNMIKSYGLKSGILKNMHAHVLRHSFATKLLTNGADVRIIQELLGHASITTTQVYTHVTNPRLKEAHRKFHT